MVIARMTLTVNPHLPAAGSPAQELRELPGIRQAMARAAAGSPRAGPVGRSAKLSTAPPMVSCLAWDSGSAPPGYPSRVALRGSTRCFAWLAGAEGAVVPPGRCAARLPRPPGQGRELAPMTATSTVSLGDGITWSMQAMQDAMERPNKIPAKTVPRCSPHLGKRCGG